MQLVRIERGELFGSGECNGALSNTSRPNNAYQATSFNLFRDGMNGLRASDHLGEQRWKLEREVR